MQDRLVLELEPGTTVAAVLERLEIPRDDEVVMMVVN